MLTKQQAEEAGFIDQNQEVILAPLMATNDQVIEPNLRTYTDINGNQQQATLLYTEGNSAIEMLSPIEGPNFPTSVSAKEYKEIAQRRRDGLETLIAGEELLATIRHITGLEGGLKRFLSGNVAGLLPKGRLDALAKYLKSARGQIAFERFERSLMRSELLSVRRGSVEQELIKNKYPDLMKLRLTADSEVVVEQLHEYLRLVQNDVYHTNHLLNPAEVPLQRIVAMPSGTRNDMYDLNGGTEQNPFLQLNFIMDSAERGLDLSGKYIKMLGTQAATLFPNTPELWSDGYDLDNNPIPTEGEIFIPLSNALIQQLY